MTPTKTILTSPSLACPDVNPEDGILWHFAPTGALLPILKHGILATHASDLSDGTECLIRNRLLTTLVDLCRDSVGKKTMSENEEVKFREAISKGSFYPVFSTSFSETPDFPYMWDNYTPEGGFAIGFSKRVVLSRTNTTKPGRPGSIIYGKCNYDKFDEEMARTDSLVNSVSALCQRLKLKYPTKSCGKMSNGWMNRVFERAEPLVFIKQWVYFREHESRLVHVLDKSMMHESMIVIGGKRRIYVSFKEPPREQVLRIIVSPKGNAETNRAIALQIADLFDIPENCIQKFDVTEFDKQPLV